MGININGDHNSVNVNGDVVFGDVNYGPPPKPPIGFFGLMFSVMVLIWLIVKFWWIVLLVVSVGAIAFTAWIERQEKRQAELEARRREEMLAARAERQNSAYLRGESWGMYGSFPPGIQGEETQ
jgi:uncharacterized membrane protein